MSAEDREKWNQKYSDPDFAPRKPSPVLLNLAEWLPPQRGRALDLAGGCGRHSIWLAQQGFDVTLADVSAVGLQVAQQRARAVGVTLKPLEHDLELQGLPVGPWDLIVSICFLWRPTPQLLRDSLRPQGVLMMIQPTTINLTRHDKPPRDFLLQPGEIQAMADDCAGASLSVCHVSEGWSIDDRHDAVLVVRRE
ncbi:class I SAM-dependent methyltransferase [Anatilimnocola floriformis]|uniref:class I SAM-dependent methyltransferase n=1 Tax=Anatilimnocola floriformis TaxID=2948575 RepID=UPI0020C37A25|nr:methyltransferase domain-containing protein [Anatilimnocola floriformis]